MALTFSPCGTWIATDYLDNLFLLSNTTNMIRGFFEGHRCRVKCLAFSPNSRMLASYSDDGCINIWYMYNLDSRYPNKQFTGTGHNGWVNNIAFSPDSTTLVSANSNLVTLWNIEAGGIIKQFTGHTGLVKSVAFSPDGAFIASGSLDKTIKLWNVETGDLIKQFTGHNGWVNSIAFSPDGNFLASSSVHDDCSDTVRLWNIESGCQIKTFGTSRLNTGTVVFSPNGKTLASYYSTTIYYWDIASGIEITQLCDRQIDAIAFSPNRYTIGYKCGDHIYLESIPHQVEIEGTQRQFQREQHNSSINGSTTILNSQQQHNSSINGSTTILNSFENTPHRQPERQPEKSYNFTNTLNSESKCPICLDPLLTDDKQELIALRCNHFFHKNCITSWCDRQQTCPICKDVIKLD